MAEQVVVRPWEGCGPTQLAFVTSEDFEIALVGPRGEGKTDGGLRRMTQMSASQPPETRPIPWLIVRDTWANLERTTLKSILFPHPNSFGAYLRPYLRVRDGGRKLELPGIWTADLFGVDSLGDIDNLQSLQLGGLWIEEPAPAAVEDIGGGMDERVVKVGITSLRHPCRWRTCQITCNYPDEDHWVWKRYALTKSKDRRLLRIPKGENIHLPKDYREKMAEALKDDQGLLQRLAEGQPGFVCQGVSVTPEFDLNIHKAKFDFEPNPAELGFRFWDGGLNPTCIFAQVSPMGMLTVFPNTCVGDNIGMIQLLEDEVVPLLDNVFPMITDWRDIGDSALYTKDSGNSKLSPAFAIQDIIGGHVERGPIEWQPRLDALRTGLNRRIKDDVPWFMISQSERQVTKALRGGWHYRVDATGRVLRDKPVKDIHSHPGDALAYGFAVLLKKIIQSKKRMTAEQCRELMDECRPAMY